MGQLTQEERLVAISDFSLGKDTFLVKSFQGTESISGLYHFRVNVISENLAISADQLLGKSGCVSLQDEHERQFFGYVSDFVVGEIESSHLRSYEITLQPWLAFLGYTHNYRIFQEKTARDIIEELFSEQGLADYEFRAMPGESREYCVQYGESDLDFVLRLLEEEGISFYFEHSRSNHKLILVDQPHAFMALPDAKLEYSKGSSSGVQITRWEHRHQYHTGNVTLSDYDFQEPDKALLSSAKTSENHARIQQFERHFTGALYHPDLGDALARKRMEAEESGRDVVLGESNASQLLAGGKFSLDKHESNAQKGAYTLLEVRHIIKDDTQGTGDGVGQSYRNEFVAVPAEVTVRPRIMRARSLMRGPHTALVVGPEGEEIYTDDQGRIKVQFHWDRLGQKDENSSCYMRVAQAWAGNQWGSFFIPRIGQEVVVDFINGDPDRPLVTGAVYNGKNKAVYSSKTQSGIKTRSTKGGSPENYNEFRFDDKKGAEQILLHAEKNYDVEVENDQSLTVDNDRRKTVRRDEHAHILNDRSKKVDNNQSEVVGKNKSIEVGEDHSERIDGNKKLEVAKNHTESIGKDMTISVKGDLAEAIKGSYHETVDKAYGLKAKTINLQADDEITLKTGSATIQLKSNGDITISGKNINVKGSGNVVIKGSKVVSN
ncbi:type VI secretion system Vgr family protein [Marinimicrobium alkaliphilum]|uniref:type VI secretion system Vgr family protein n=1 Tax=Marinimicrobium alkaliphilum TaxID=2202654 RepID=UPI000DBA3BD8|nr:type VI secretion system tip protein TssI/VgrG [Marinimicrobium alkaliphilum]